MSYVIGIDPGLSGAIALLDTLADTVVKVWDMPTMKKTHGKGKEINAYLLVDIVDEAIEIVGSARLLSATIERVNAAPMQGRKQGAASMFTFGQSVGIVVGVLASKNIPVKYALPSAWKRFIGLIAADKKASIGVAINLYPECAASLYLKKHDGRADAILIAAYARAN